MLGIDPVIPKALDGLRAEVAVPMDAVRKHLGEGANELVIELE